MRRFRGFGRRRRKWHTNWVPGLNFGESLEFATITLETNVPAAGINNFTAALTDDADLAQSGGENAVVTRVVGELHFFGARYETTPAPAHMRWALFTADDVQGVIALRNLWLNTDLDNEDIISSGSLLVPGVDVTTASNDTMLDESSRWVHIDTSAKRRLDDERQLYFTMQFAPSPSHAGATVTSVLAQGFLRVLLTKALP